MKLPPFFQQFSPDQLRRQYAKNAASLRAMAEKAERTGKKVNGFTADYLRATATRYAELAKGGR